MVFAERTSLGESVYYDEALDQHRRLVSPLGLLALVHRLDATTAYAVAERWADSLESTQEQRYAAIDFLAVD